MHTLSARNSVHARANAQRGFLRHRLPLAIAISMLAVIAMVWAGAVFVARHDRASVASDWRENSANRTRVLEEQTPRTIGMTPQTVYADSDQRERYYYAAAGFMTVVVLLIGWWLLVMTRRAEQEIHEARLLLDAVIENMPDMIFIKDAKNLRFVQLNRAGEELLGRAREELLGKCDHDLFPREQADFFTAKDRAVLAGRALVDIAQEPIQSRTLGERFLQTKKMPILDPAGNPRYLLGISQDITERLRAETTLKSMNALLMERAEQLAAANRELEAFSYSVSHDLRAPLRHINGFASLWQQQADGAPAGNGAQYMEKILAAATRMGRMIDDLLALSRTARTGLNKSPVALGPLVADIVAELQQAAGDRAIEWVTGVLPTVRADRNLLRLALFNLLDNAVKYTGTRAAGRIEITSAQKDGNEIIAVRDNGVGFDMKYAHKLFGVFQRLHSDKEFAGTGTGLANVARIVQRHGGRVWAESEVGQGAAFFVALPDAGES